GAPKGTGKSNQQQGAIADVLQPRSHGFEHEQKVLPEQGLCLPLGAASRSFDAPQRRPDELRAGWVRSPSRLVCLRYRRDAPDKGRNAKRVGMCGKVTGNSFG